MSTSFLIFDDQLMDDHPGIDRGDADCVLMIDSGGQGAETVVSPSSLVTMAQEVTRSKICPEIEAITPVLHQRTIRKPLITSGAGFNGYQYGMNSGNGLSDNV